MCGKEWAEPGGPLASGLRLDLDKTDRQDCEGVIPAPAPPGRRETLILSVASVKVIMIHV